MKQTGGDEINAGELKVSTRRLVADSSWAVVEQGLFACGSVATHLILARMLEPSGYGLFAVGYAVILFVRTIYEAIATEPMTVFGPGRFAVVWPDYLKVILFRVFFPLMAAFAAISALAGLALWSFGEPTLAAITASLAIATPSWLSFITVRRALYVVQRIRVASLLSAAYGTTVAIGLMLVSLRVTISPAIGFLVISAGSIGVGAAGLAVLGVGRPSGEMTDKKLVRDVFVRHRSYGGWSILAGLIRWIPENIGIVLLPITHGADAAAAFRAAYNFILPALQACSAFRAYLTPTFVKQRLGGQLGSAISTSLRLATVFGGLYVVVMLLTQEFFYDWVYAGRYVEARKMLWILGLMVWPAGGGAVATSGLQSLERPDLVFRAYVVAVACGGPLIVLLTLIHGIHGSVLATVVCQWLIFAALALKLGMLRQGERGANVRKNH